MTITQASAIYLKHLISHLLLDELHRRDAQVRVLVPIYLYMYLYTYISDYIYIYIYMCACGCVCVCVCVCVWRACVHVFVRLHTHTCVCIYIYIYIFVHIYRVRFNPSYLLLDEFHRWDAQVRVLVALAVVVFARNLDGGALGLARDLGVHVDHHLKGEHGIK